MLTGMAANSFKRVSLTSEETAFANLLARTRANFDGGTSFANDAAVLAAIKGTSTDALQSFSAPGISELDGYCFGYGGGHTDSGDGSFYGFDLEAAAANINGGGSGTAWDLLVPSGRYLDSFTNSEPAGSSQTAVTVATGTGQSYWITTNKNGRQMPSCGHTYHTIKFMPGTKTVLLSNFGGFDPNANGTIGAPWCYDITSDTLTGPITPSLIDSGDGLVTTFGYAQPDNTNGLSAGVAPGSDGNVYGPFGATFGWGVYVWKNATSASIAVLDIAPNQTTPIFQGSKDPGNFIDSIVIPDPANASDLVLVQHGPGSSFADTNIMIATGLKNVATPALNFQTYASGSVTTNGREYLSYAYDTVRGVIWMTDGDNLFQITPNASLSGWTIAQITGFSGDTPPTPPDTAHLPALQYLPGDDCLVHSYVGRVAVYKPPGWSPPTGASGVVPVASLTATPAGSSTNVTAQGSSSPTAAAIRSTGKPLNGAASAVAALLRRIGKPPAANSNAVASLVRRDGKPVSASGVAAATSVRSTSKPLAGSSSPVATAATIKTKLQSALALATTVAALLRQTSKAVNGNQAPIASLMRSTGKTEQGSGAPVATASTIRVKLQSALASTAPVGTMVRQTGKLALALASAAATLSRQVNKVAQSIASAAATLARQTGKPSKASALAIGSLTAIKVHLIAALAAAISVASLVRRTGKLAPSSAAQQAPLARVTAKNMAASIAPLASFSTGRRFALAFQAVTTAIASTLAAFLSSLTANLARLVGLGRRPRRSVGLEAAAKRTVGRGEKPKRTV